MLLWQLRSLLVTLMIAVVIAAAMVASRTAEGIAPMIKKAEQLRFPRWLAVSIVYLTLLAGLVGAGLIIGPTLASQIQTLISLIPVYLDTLRSLTENIALKLGTEQPELIDRFFDTQALTSWMIGSGQQLLVRSYGFTRGVIDAVLSLVLALFLSAYMIADSENLIKGIVNLFPQPWDERLASQIVPISQRMGSYIQGRVLVSGILGVAITLGLGILGLSEFALALGVILVLLI